MVSIPGIRGVAAPSLQATSPFLSDDPIEPVPLSFLREGHRSAFSPISRLAGRIVPLPSSVPAHGGAGASPHIDEDPRDLWRGTPSTVFRALAAKRPVEIKTLIAAVSGTSSRTLDTDRAKLTDGELKAAVNRWARTVFTSHSLDSDALKAIVGLTCNELNSEWSHVYRRYGKKGSELLSESFLLHLVNCLHHAPKIVRCSLLKSLTELPADADKDTLVYNLLNQCHRCLSWQEGLPLQQSLVTDHLWTKGIIPLTKMALYECRIDRTTGCLTDLTNHNKKTIQTAIQRVITDLIKRAIFFPDVPLSWKQIAISHVIHTISFSPCSRDLYVGLDLARNSLIHGLLPRNECLLIAFKAYYSSNMTDYDLLAEEFLGEQEAVRNSIGARVIGAACKAGDLTNASRFISSLSNREQIDIATEVLRAHRRGPSPCVIM